MGRYRKLYRRQHEGKHPFEEANVAEIQAQIYSSNSFWPVSSYLCKWCGYYHVGHIPEWRPFQDKQLEESRIGQ